MQREPRLPRWAQELKDRYLSGEASMFMVHGNVRDLVPWEEGEQVRYLSIRSFLERFLGRSKEIVVYYNCSEGFEFPDRAHRGRFLRAVNARRVIEGEQELLELSRSPSDALPVIEDLVTDPAQRAGVIIDYVETIVPMGDLAFMSDLDKANLVALQRWATDPGLLNSDNLVILVSENPSDVHRRVVSNAQLAAVEVPLPNDDERLDFVRSVSRRGVEIEMPEQRLAQVTAGLSAIQIRGLFRQAQQSGRPITYRSVSARKKSIIEQECHGLVEFVDPGHDFSHVGGLERIKVDLMQMATAIKKGHRNRVPMGVIFVGPMGTGKTFVAEAFAAESGLTCLKFKNFREKWVGSTEGNLEKILHVVQALGYVLLIIDEADRSLSGGGDGDGGTSSRVVARLKEFMSDTAHRGRVVTLMMTNRPDKIDTDLKRPGRFDVKIPFFFPEEDDERLAILQAITRKNKLDLVGDVDWAPIVDGTKGYSGAELESVLLAAARLASIEDRVELSQADLEQALVDVIPSRDTRMLDFMEMLAVFEASARRMLPSRHAELSTEEVHARLDQLRMALGSRVL
jgi:transitional endoplasmic reticulum ATPase